METWLPVVGFEGLYEVSDHGHVRRLPREHLVRGGGIAMLPGGTMSPYKMKKLGHLAIDLTPPDGPRRRTRVHTLVLEAFVGPRPDGHVGCHNDGDVENNHLSNLRWDTYSENNYDIVRHGNHHWAKKTQCSYGHPLDGVWGNGKRYCRTCRRAAVRDYKARKRAGEPMRAPGRPPKTT